MSKSTSNIVEFADPVIEKDLLTELIRQRAQQLLSKHPTCTVLQSFQTYTVSASLST